MSVRLPRLLVTLLAVLVLAAGVALGARVAGAVSAEDPACVTDAAGDQRARVNPDAPLEETATTLAAADLVEVCLAEAPEGTTATLAVAGGAIESATARVDAESGIVVGLAPGGPFLVLGGAPDGSGPTAAVVDADGAERCRAEVTAEGPRLTVTGLPAACTGGATGPVTATSRLDVDPARPRTPVLVDVAPDAAAVVAGAAPAAADGRLAGPGRIQTAIEISRTAFPDSARSVYLARADVLVDAVASGSLTDGPVLLVPTCGAVPADVEAEIARLDPDEVVAVGGTEAVCDAALAEAAAGRSAGRVAGPDRVATPAAVAARAFPVGASDVYLAGAGALADAVPAGTLTQGPLLLVPSCGELPGVVAAALRRLVPERVVALGGADAVCEELVEAAAGEEPALRLAGPGRLATAVAIARRAFPGGAPTVYVARADDAADAVAGGSLRDGPILLVPRCGDVPAEILAAVRRLRPDRVVALGGTAAVCDAALAELVEAG